MNRNVRVFDFGADQDRLSAGFDADAEVLAARRGRIALFAAGVPIRLTKPEIEQILVDVDRPERRHRPDTQLLYWRLTTVTRNPAILATIEDRLACDFEESLAVSASNGTVVLDNETPEQE